MAGGETAEDDDKAFEVISALKPPMARRVAVQAGKC